MRLRWSLGHGLTAMYNLTRTQQYLLLLMLIYRGLGFLIHNYIVLQCDLPHTVGRHPRAEIRTRDAGDVQAENLTTRLSHLLPHGECLGGRMLSWQYFGTLLDRGVEDPTGCLINWSLGTPPPPPSPRPLPSLLPLRTNVVLLWNVQKRTASPHSSLQPPGDGHKTNANAGE